MCDVGKNFEAGLSGDIGGKWKNHQKGWSDLSGKTARNQAKKSAADAAQMEAERQARITWNVGDINAAFAGREPQYEQLGAALRDYLNGQLSRQRADITRQGKFSLARSGLTGGSAAVDLGRNITREAQEGALNAERQARAGVANLRGQDEQARTQLISLAQSGSDIGNAAAQTANALRANLESARNTNNFQGLGDVFGGSAQVIKTRRDADERRRGYDQATTYANPFAR